MPLHALLIHLKRCQENLEIAMCLCICLRVNFQYFMIGLKCKIELQYFTFGLNLI